MTTVRPPIWPTAQPAATPVRDARSAAFFQAALARSAPPATVEAALPQPIRTEPRASQPQPAKILRPGSLLDIKV